MSPRSTVLSVKVSRRDGPNGSVRWDAFNIERDLDMTVADVLHLINAEPRTADGQLASAIVWESACTWPACGVCTMLINGKAAPACGTRLGSILRKKRGKLTLAPLDAFPVRRDLWVDRTRMMRDAARAEAFRDGERHATPAAAELSPALMSFSGCTRCGACVDACPEAHERSVFMGPYALGAMHATRLSLGDELPASVVQSGGIVDCGHVQNCMEACPEAIPLDRAIVAASSGGFKRWLNLLMGRD